MFLFWSPWKPPDVYFLTPSGRFETNKKICLSLTGYHPEHWRPAWGVSTALIAIISFIPTPGEGAIGALDYSERERAEFAKASRDFVCLKCGSKNAEALPDESVVPSTVLEREPELEFGISKKDKERKTEDPTEEETLSKDSGDIQELSPSSHQEILEEDYSKSKESLDASQEERHPPEEQQQPLPMGAREPAWTRQLIRERVLGSLRVPPRFLDPVLQRLDTLLLGKAPGDPGTPSLDALLESSVQLISVRFSREDQASLERLRRRQEEVQGLSSREQRNLYLRDLLVPLIQSHLEHPHTDEIVEALLGEPSVLELLYLLEGRRRLETRLRELQETIQRGKHLSSLDLALLGLGLLLLMLVFKQLRGLIL